jgi:uncharacterized protein
MQKTALEKRWESAFLDYFSHEDQGDASHDLGHFRRVASVASRIAALEQAPVDALVILAAAYFHDIVNLPKNHPERKFASRYSAEKATKILAEMDFPNEKLGPVSHAIQAHSFSAQLTPETLEAKIIQDADRMEALGALGIMRTFYVSGRLGTLPYHPADLFAAQRTLDDKAYALDHFYCKLFKLPGLLQTKGGREIALQRTQVLQQFVDELEVNLNAGEGGALFVAHACREAGMKNYKFFCSEDPMARDRPLMPHLFVIDIMIASLGEFPGFLASFLNQFETEIIIS